MNRPRLILMVLALCAALAGGLYYAATRPTSTQLTATGTIEVTKYDVTPRLAGYIRNLSIQEGDFLHTDEVVCTIERDDLKHQNQGDWQAVAAAQAKLTDLQRGARDQELSMAQRSVGKTAAVLQKAQADLERYTTLFQSGAISKQMLDETQQAFDVANEDYRSAQENYDLIAAGTREDQITAQQAELEKAIFQAQANESLIKDTQVLSPINGFVLSKNYETNEYVPAGSPILTLADTSDYWLKVYVGTSNLGQVHLGQAVDVHVDAFPNDVFHGTVSEISDKAEYTPRQSITKNERANLVFSIKIRLPNDDGRLKAGMPGDVIFHD